MSTGMERSLRIVWKGGPLREADRRDAIGEVRIPPDAIYQPVRVGPSLCELHFVPPF